MPQTVEDLGKLVKSKYAGQYDDLGDAELGQKVKAKYPGSYDDFGDVPTPAPQQQMQAPVAEEAPDASVPPAASLNPMARPRGQAVDVSQLPGIPKPALPDELNAALPEVTPAQASVRRFAPAASAQDLQANKPLIPFGDIPLLNDRGDVQPGLDLANARTVPLRSINQMRQEHPEDVGVGLMHGISRAAEGATTPARALAIGGLAVAPPALAALAAAGFTTQQAMDVVGQSPEAMKAYQEGRWGDFADTVSSMAAEAGMAAASVHHGLKRAKAGLEAHNVAAEEALAQERAQLQGQQQGIDLSSQVLPEPIPVTIKGKPATIQPTGAGDYAVIDAETGKQLAVGSARNIQDKLASMGAVPSAEGPPPEPPAIIRQAAAPPAPPVDEPFLKDASWDQLRQRHLQIRNLEEALHNGPRPAGMVDPGETIYADNPAWDREVLNQSRGVYEQDLKEISEHFNVDPEVLRTMVEHDQTPEQDVRSAQVRGAQTTEVQQAIKSAVSGLSDPKTLADTLIRSAAGTQFVQAAKNPEIAAKLDKYPTIAQAIQIVAKAPPVAEDREMGDPLHQQAAADQLFESLGVTPPKPVKQVPFKPAKESAEAAPAPAPQLTPAPAVKPIKAVDKSEKNFPVLATITGNNITASVKATKPGREDLSPENTPNGSIAINLQDWPTEQQHPNPLYWQRELVKQKMIEAGLADFNGPGAAVSERVADSKVRAINTAIGVMLGKPAPAPSGHPAAQALAPTPASAAPQIAPTTTGSSPVEPPEEKHEFSSTQVQLPEPIASALRGMGARIPDEHIAKDGREEDAHVTVKFGLHGDDPGEVRRVVEQMPPIRLKLGKTSLFRNDEADVVKVDVDSPDLHALNRAISAALPNTDTHPTYQPHATIAYVKPGEGKRYEGLADLKGQEAIIDHIVFSGKDRRKTVIPLLGKQEIVHEPAVTPEPGPTDNAGVSPAEQAPAQPAAEQRAEPAGAPSQEEAAPQPAGAVASAPVQAPVAQPVHTHWLDSLSPEQRESAFAVMRTIDGEADKGYAESTRLSPRAGEVAAGGAHMDPLIRAEGIRGFNSALGKGASVSEAVEAGNQRANEAVEHWNSKPGVSYDVKRPLDMERSRLTAIGQQIAAAVAETPATLAAPAAVPATPKKGVPAKRRGIAKAAQTPIVEGDGQSGQQAEPTRDLTGAPDSGALGEVPAQNVPGAGEQGPTDRVGERGSDTDVRRPVRADSSKEGSVQPGVGSGEGGLGVSSERGGSASPGDRPGEIVRPDRRERGSDYRITDADRLGEGGPKAKAKDNLEAIRLLKQIEAESRPATPAEQAKLVKYVGWGQLSQAFDSRNREWSGIYEDLRSLLTPEEHRAASGSTLNAHYTSPQVVKAMWDAAERLGVKPGSVVLEPSMGVGHFFGMTPGSLLQDIRRTGVELDSTTGRIAKLLYPNAAVHVAGFEQVKTPNNFYDLAIGNVPFGDYGVTDTKYKKNPAVTRFIHDYFFAKSLDAVRPGGLVMFITSRGTMDKNDAGMRKYFGARADLVAAIRLPNTAFKGNAGTEVTTDILVLQKRAPGQEPKGETWAETLPIASPNGSIHVNEYFARHPEMMLGKMTREGTMYRADEPTLQGELTPEILSQAVARLPQNVVTPWEGRSKAFAEAVPLSEVPAAGTIKENGFGLTKTGEVVRRDGAEIKPFSANKEETTRIKGMIGVRDAVREVYRTQLQEEPEVAIIAARKELGRAYDKFVKQHGPLSSKKNIRAFSGDPDQPLLLSLENYDPDAETATKAAIFQKRTIQSYKPVEHAETAAEALAVSQNETGRVDWTRMQEMTGKTPAEMQLELAGLVYKDPEKGYWMPADEYLSGNVRAKLEAAEAAAATIPAYRRNADALREVQPKDLEPGEIDARLGAAWVPTEDVAQFVSDTLQVPAWAVRVNYAVPISTWTLGMDTSSVANTTVYGTPSLTARDLIDDALNLRIPTVYDRHSDGTRTVNQEQTALAREKQEQLKGKFKEWLWSDDKRATRLARKYNDEFNNERGREYNGAHLTLPGMARLALRSGDLEPHQKNGVWRIIAGGKNVLLAHVVGSGKTFVMVAGAMEQRRLGLARKPMLVVPNHMVEQIGADFLKLYPNANVFIAGKDYFNTGNRQKAMARIANNDYDAVIVAHSSFGKLPVSDETHTSFIQEQLDELEDALREMTATEGKRGKTVKQLEKAKKRLEVRLKERTDVESRDIGVSFEELGVDSLYVDEADLFKNLYFTTKMTRIAGLNNTDSKRAMDMFMKTRYITRRNGGRGVVFATGTPISNTMAEAYTVQRYLQEDYMREQGVSTFDAWAQNFGEAVTGTEVAPDGSGFRSNTRFAKFTNLPELIHSFRRVADVQTAEMLNLPRPRLATGKAEAVVAPGSDLLRAFVKTLIARAEAIRGGGVDPRQDNMLKITGDGRNAALDLRLVLGPDAPDLPDSKVNKAVDNLRRIWEAGKDGKLTQLLFCDLSTPKEHGFSVYADIRSKLIAKGVPEKEIAFIHSYDADAEKARLFADVNNGKVRILLGSTEKMGAGTNVQKRLVALHHLDAPWRPRDIEQREGRILRQGNENKEVHVLRYVTESSFDAYMWQTLESKARMIAAALSADTSVRSMEDVDESALTYAEMKAIASGNPAVMEKVKVDAEVRKLGQLRAAHFNEQIRIRRSIAALPGQIQFFQKSIAGREADVNRRDAAEEKKEAFSVTAGGKTFTGKGAREEAGKAINDLVLKNRNDRAPYKIGSLLGFDLMAEGRGPERVIGAYDSNLPRIWAQGAEKWTANLNPESGAGTIASLESSLRNIEHHLTASRHGLAKAQQEAKDYKEQLGKPFQHEAKLDGLVLEQDRLNKSLDLDKGDTQVASPDEGPEDEEPEAPAQQKGHPAKRFLADERGSITLSALTGGADKFVTQDVIPLLRAIKGSWGENKDLVLKLFAPAARGSGAAPAAHVLQHHLSEMAQQQDRAIAALQHTRDLFSKLPEDTRWNFVDAVETGDLTAIPGDLQPIATQLRDMLDGRRDEVRALGTGRLEQCDENYFPHIWKNFKQGLHTSDKEGVLPAQPRRPMAGTQRFLKQRTVPTIREGMEERGLIPISDNPVDLVILKLREMDKYLMAHRVIQELREMGLLHFVKVKNVGKAKKEDGYTMIDDRIATVSLPGARGGYETMGHYMAPDQVATIINNYLAPGLRGNSLFRSYVGLANVLNTFQLGFSAFHVGFTTLDAAVSKLAIGTKWLAAGDLKQAGKAIGTSLGPVAAGIGIAAIGAPAALAGAVLAGGFAYGAYRNMVQGSKMLREWSNPGSEGGEIAAMIDAAKAGGARANMDEFYATNFSQKMTDALRSGNLWSGAWRAPFALAEQAMRPIMRYIVPRQKMGVFADMARYEIAQLKDGYTTADYRAAMARAWASVDNRMGQMVYDNLHWNHVVKDLLMASIRSVGWNVGSLREGVGGVKDFGKFALDAAMKQAMPMGGAGGKPPTPRPDPEYTHRMAYIIASAVLLGATGALLQFLMTGKWPEDIKDCYFPKTGKLDENGRPQRLFLPSYAKEVFHYFHDPGTTAANKLHPAISLMAEVWRNQDYYGTAIYNEDAEPQQKAYDIGKHVLAQGFKPFAWRGMERLREQGARPLEQAAPFFGVTPAPRSVNETEAEALASRYLSKRRDQQSHTPAEKEHSDLVRSLARGVRLGKDDGTKVREALNAGKITARDLATIHARSQHTPLQTQVQSLPLPQALNVYAKASGSEKQDLLPILQRKYASESRNPYRMNPNLRKRVADSGILSADQ